jgi:hypothetical protein
MLITENQTLFRKNMKEIGEKYIADEIVDCVEEV